MKLSQGEKLILLALAHQQDGKEQLDMALIRSAILSGNLWALSWELSGVPAEDVDPQIAEETASILSMWRVIEQAVAALGEAERATLRDDADPYALEFEGFDGNHDDHHGVATFLVKEMVPPMVPRMAVMGWLPDWQLTAPTLLKTPKQRGSGHA